MTPAARRDVRTQGVSDHPRVSSIVCVIGAECLSLRRDSLCRRLLFVLGAIQTLMTYPRAPGDPERQEPLCSTLQNPSNHIFSIYEQRMAIMYFIVRIFGKFSAGCILLRLKPLVMQECGMGGVSFNEIFLHENQNVNKH